MCAAGCDLDLENIGLLTVEDRLREIFAPDHPRRYLRELAYVSSAILPKVIKQGLLCAIGAGKCKSACRFKLWRPCEPGTARNWAALSTLGNVGLVNDKRGDGHIRVIVLSIR